MTATDVRERCISVLHVINTDIKRLGTYPLDFSDEIEKLQKLKKEVEQKLSNIEEVESLAKVASAKADMSLKVSKDELVTLGAMEGIR